MGESGIFAPDEVTFEWYRRKGITDLPYPRFQPGDQVDFDIDETLDLSELVPFIAKPFAPGNAFPADEVALEIAQQAELYDDKGGLGPYYNRLSRLSDLLDKLAMTSSAFPSSCFCTSAQVWQITSCALGRKISAILAAAN